MEYPVLILTGLWAMAPATPQRRGSRPRRPSNTPREWAPSAARPPASPQPASTTTRRRVPLDPWQEVRALLPITREIDACGIGFVADAQGRPSRSIIEAALRGLACVKHRGAVAADARTADGSGLLAPVPAAIFGERTGVATLFCRGAEPRAEVAEAAAAEGLTVVDWRVPPTDPDARWATSPATWRRRSCRCCSAPPTSRPATTSGPRCGSAAASTTPPRAPTSPPARSARSSTRAWPRPTPSPTSTSTWPTTGSPAPSASSTSGSRPTRCPRGSAPSRSARCATTARSTPCGATSGACGAAPPSARSRPASARRSCSGPSSTTATPTRASSTPRSSSSPGPGATCATSWRWSCRRCGRTWPTWTRRSGASTATTRP